MREIKFRGKVKYNGNHYFSGDWVYGFYFIDEQDNHYIIDSTPDEFGNARFAHVQIIPETVGQYTCLKDKNGKEIYEGDIIRDGKGGDGVVQYVSNISAFMMLADGQYWYLNEGDPDRSCRLVYTEIIGNIHENPEHIK